MKTQICARCKRHSRWPFKRVKFSLEHTGKIIPCTLPCHCGPLRERVVTLTVAGTEKSQIQSNSNKHFYLLYPQQHTTLPATFCQLIGNKEQYWTSHQRIPTRHCWDGNRMFWCEQYSSGQAHSKNLKVAESGRWLHSCKVRWYRTQPRGGLLQEFP